MAFLSCPLAAIFLVALAGFFPIALNAYITIREHYRRWPSSSFLVDALLLMVSTTEALSSANELLTAHSGLMSRVRQSQQSHRRQLHTLPSPPMELIRLPIIPSPPRSRSPSPPPSPPPRKTIPPRSSSRKTCTTRSYRTYVPEEETIRNDYSQRYVDGGEWPQNWVLGAEPGKSFLRSKTHFFFDN
jgi:hypothetical protein